MNHVLSAVGLVAAAVGITVAVPQVWRLWRGTNAAGMSRASAVLGLLASSGWLSYGTLLLDPAQILANAPGIVGATAVLVLVLRRGGFSARPAVLAATAWIGVLGACYLLQGATSVGFAATAATLVARGPQVWTTYREDVLTALSPASFALASVSASLWVVYGLGTHDVPVWTCSITALSMSLAILARYAYVSARLRPSTAVLTGPIPLPAG